jgi:hypothetical protein
VNGITRYAFAVGGLPRDSNGPATSRLTWPNIQSSTDLASCRHQTNRWAEVGRTPHGYSEDLPM